jgi:hypothetical protein
LLHETGHVEMTVCRGGQAIATSSQCLWLPSFAIAAGSRREQVFPACAGLRERTYTLPRLNGLALVGVETNADLSRSLIDATLREDCGRAASASWFLRQTPGVRARDGALAGDFRSDAHHHASQGCRTILVPDSRDQGDIRMNSGTRKSLIYRSIESHQLGEMTTVSFCW